MSPFAFIRISLAAIRLLWTLVVLAVTLCWSALCAVAELVVFVAKGGARLFRSVRESAAEDMRETRSVALGERGVR